MIGKIAFLLVVISVVACSPIAKEWPADLFPGLCPDYPNCDMEILAKFMPDGHPRTIDIPIFRSPMYVMECITFGMCNRVVKLRYNDPGFQISNDEKTSKELSVAEEQDREDEEEINKERGVDIPYTLMVGHFLSRLQNFLAHTGHLLRVFAKKLGTFSNISGT